jgi:surfeit locus 1 family protein
MTGTRFWVITLAALLAAALTCRLGFWQWGRAADKIALESAISERNRLPALDWRAPAAIENIANKMHRPVLLRGRWAQPRTVYLDNRQMQAKPGFYVVTPLVLDDGRAVAVQRGWVQRNFEQREKLPAVSTPDGTVEVAGRIAPPPARLYQFGGAGTGAIRQNLDLAAWRAETGLNLETAWSVQQTGPASEGLLRDWPQPASGVEKHYGYAFQWWALSALIALLYVWFQFIAPRRRRPPA